jgi:hypothetical protein
MNDYKVCIVIPAGRKKYMQLLIPQILNQSHSWDELQIWKNTNVREDLEYINSLPTMSEKIRVIEPSISRRGNDWAGNTIYPFFKNTVDPNTVYIRFDDDVCYIDPFLIRRLAKKRWEDKSPFLISPLVINNAICTALIQHLGLAEELPKVGNKCMDEIGWRDARFAESLHRWFLDKGREEIEKLDTIYVTSNRYSINCISWLGSKFAEFNGEVGHDEEQWLSEDYPKRNGLSNEIHTNLVCAHFAFYPQKDHLDSTDILQCYENFINNK